MECGSCVQDFAPVTGVTVKTCCCFFPAGRLYCLHAPARSLQLSKPGVLSQASGFLECSFLPVLPGDVLLNLQTRLKFHFLLEASPDLSGPSQVLPKSRCIPNLVHLDKDSEVYLTLRDWLYRKPKTMAILIHLHCHLLPV